MLFAAEMFPELNKMNGRRFEMEGDVERAFQSGGLDETRLLAERHFGAAGRPGSYVKPFTCSKGRKFESVRGRREPRAYKK